MPENFDEKILTIREVSEFLKIPLSTLYELVQKGKIPGKKIGRHWRFLQRDVLDFLGGGARTGPAKSGHEEKRRSPRMNVEGDCVYRVLLSARLEKEETGEICNLSEDGLCILMKPKWDGRNFEVPAPSPQIQVGDPVHVFFRIPEMATFPVGVRGRVTRKFQDSVPGVAVKFRNLSKELQAMIHDYVG